MTENTPKRGPKPKAEAIPDGMVKVRVLPLGDGKVSKGETFLEGSAVLFNKAAKGDFLIVAEDVALAQEANGLVEIV